MFAVKGGIDFLLNNSASSLDALMSVQSRKEFIDSQTCQICGVFDPTSGYRHSCDVFFHKKCLLSWTHHALGEILNFKHSECPACQQMLQVDVLISTAILGKIFVLREKIQSLDPKKYWKACKSCREIFDAGDRSCEDIASLSDRCDKCLQKIITCPGCGLALEHAGGCSEFRCYLYSIDKCKEKEDEGLTCDHGASKTVQIKLCGHTWRISTSVMNID